MCSSFTYIVSTLTINKFSNPCSLLGVSFILQTCYTSVCFIIQYNVSFRLLNGNLLEGRVPEQLYSVGVHGGAIE